MDISIMAWWVRVDAVYRIFEKLLALKGVQLMYRRLVSTLGPYILNSAKSTLSRNYL